MRIADLPPAMRRLILDTPDINEITGPEEFTDGDQGPKNRMAAGKRWSVGAPKTADGGSEEGDRRAALRQRQSTGRSVSDVMDRPVRVCGEAMPDLFQPQISETAKRIGRSSQLHRNMDPASTMYAHTHP